MKNIQDKILTAINNYKVITFDYADEDDRELLDRIVEPHACGITNAGSIILTVIKLEEKAQKNPRLENF